MSNGDRRVCPDCGSSDVVVTQRGFAGPTDDRHQHFSCVKCGRVTFEILARTAREMKLERTEAGHTVEADGHYYRVMRVLKIGLDEFLLYVRPDDPPRTPHRSRRDS